MKTRAHVHSSNVVSARTLETVSLRREAKTRIQQRDWWAKKFAASSTNHVAGFLFSLRVARTNSPSGKRALYGTIWNQTCRTSNFSCLWQI